MKNKQGFLPLALLIAILVVVAGGGAYYFVKQTKLAPVAENKTDKQIQESTTEALQAQSSVPSDWKTYRNEKFGFEIQYPQDYVVEEGFPCGNPNCPYFAIGVVLTKYSKSIFDTPGLIIDSVPPPTGFVEGGVFGRVFRKEDRGTSTIAYESGPKTEFSNSLQVYFQENSQIIHAGCEIYNDSVDTTINSCNQILSTFTFKFTK